ncbi:MAG: hypothetical protein G01um10148_118 [Parcubacteria group bacterium Gr01-1014_8]|nr:MAG: hypothetical protein G01um10148_118 [Parcubacteria group bacterium Gr01-1014_8]
MSVSAYRGRSSTYFYICAALVLSALFLIFPKNVSAVTLPFSVRIGSGGINSNATGNGELYVQNDVEADAYVYFAGLPQAVTDQGTGLKPVCVDSDGKLWKSNVVMSGCSDITDGDIAEWHETRSDVIRGDIIVPSDGLVSREIEIRDPLTKKKTGETYIVSTPIMRKADYASRNNALGVVATQPAQIIGVDILSVAKHPQPIGLSGHVPVRMTLDGGGVSIGDAITISRTTPGAGMKALESGRIIGYALEPFTSDYTSHDGMIEVTVNLQDWVQPHDRPSRTSIGTRLYDLGIKVLDSLLAVKSFVNYFASSLLLQEDE